MASTRRLPTASDRQGVSPTLCGCRACRPGFRHRAVTHVSIYADKREGGMRRPRITIWQLMATVAVAAVLLWGGTLARDYFFPPPAPPLPPIPEPVLPDGEWLEDPPSPGTADMRIWTRADDVLCNIDSPRRRRVVFRLDRSKRLWVRDYKAEALLRKPPAQPTPSAVRTPGGSATR